MRLVRAAIDTELLKRVAAGRRHPTRAPVQLPALRRRPARQRRRRRPRPRALRRGGDRRLQDRRGHPRRRPRGGREAVLPAFSVAIYALAALRDGATASTSVTSTSSAPAPVVARYDAADAPRLAAELRSAPRRCSPANSRRGAHPWLGLCATCPGRAALCEHPPELTERLLAGVTVCRAAPRLALVERAVELGPEQERTRPDPQPQQQNDHRASDPVGRAVVREVLDVDEEPDRRHDPHDNPAHAARCTIRSRSVGSTSGA